jgi:hypothetical protein
MNAGIFSAATTGELMSITDLSRQDMADAVADLVQNSQHVRINEPRLKELGRRVAAHLQAKSDEDLAGNIVDPAEAPTLNDRDTLQYFLMRRSQSFVIWRWTGDPAQPVEAFDCHVNGKLYTGERAVNACIMRALNDGVPLLDPEYLERMTLAELEDVYRDDVTHEVTYQRLDWRLEKLHEIGRVLREEYGGHMANLLTAADGRLFREDGQGSIQALVSRFPKSYGDYPFAKLAVTLMYALHSRRTAAIESTDEYLQLTRIDDPENSFGPTDYYIPMFLIRWGVFEISPQFAEHLRNRTEIAQGSALEMEYRAATLTVFDRIVEQTGTPLTLLDTEFWYQGAFRCRPCHPGVDESAVPCPIRDDCTGYQRDLALMDLGWPLVYTPFY